MSDKLTFNEALKEINELSFTADNGESWVNSYTSVYALIQELQEVYAPTIEMTQEAYNELSDLRSHNRDLDGVLSHAMLPYNPLIRYTTEELAQAWLHPETVKVVE